MPSVIAAVTVRGMAAFCILAIAAFVNPFTSDVTVEPPRIASLKLRASVSHKCLHNSGWTRLMTMRINNATHYPTPINHPNMRCFHTKAKLFSLTSVNPIDGMLTPSAIAAASSASVIAYIRLSFNLWCFFFGDR